MVHVLSAVLTSDGSVWTWGSNTDCQLGRALDAASAVHESCPKAVAGPAAVHHGKMLFPASSVFPCLVLCLTCLCILESAHKTAQFTCSCPNAYGIQHTFDCALYLACV